MPRPKIRGRALMPIAVVDVLGCLAPAASVQATEVPSTAAAAKGPSRTGDEPRVPAGFSEQKVRADDIAINYVRGGRGPTLLLLHGYPQTWYTWREILPELAKHYGVIAPDLRDAPKSDTPKSGYDKKTLAADPHGLLTRLGLNHGIRLVGQWVERFVDSLEVKKNGVSDKQVREHARHLRDNDVADNTVNARTSSPCPCTPPRQSAQLSRRKTRILAPLFPAFLAILAAVLYPSAASSSTSTARQAAKPTIVLVHGAFADANPSLATTADGAVQSPDA